MVITRSFDVALNGRGYTALPKVNEKWRAIEKLQRGDGEVKMCCAITPNAALHKKQEHNCCVCAAACYGLGFFLATQTAFFLALANDDERRQYLNCRVAKTTILVVR